MYENIIRDIRKLSSKLDKITIMEICGGHTNVIMKNGIRDILPRNIRLISGPGCPVCVTSQKDIDNMIELANQGIKIATYGDMLKVPGSRSDLEHAKAKYGNVHEVYSAMEALNISDDIVFFGVGFETTAPMSAYLLEKGVMLYSVHKLVPPAIEMLVSDGMNIDAFILPGHVSTIIGKRSYRTNLPQVITGFSPQNVLSSIKIILEQVKENKSQVINAYPEAVKDNGNKKALDIIKRNFKVVDSEWRGLGVIPDSGLEVKDKNLDAKIKYKDIFKRVPGPKKTACRCAEVLKGLIEPKDCRLFFKKCRPDRPIGPCMVSDEGSCSIYYNYVK